MKIKTKLILAFLIISLFAISFTSFIATRTIIEKYKDYEKNKIINSKEQVEALFYDQLSELKRKLIMLANFKEVLKNLNNKDKLYVEISSKFFLVEGLNFGIFDKNFNLILHFKGSVSDFVDIKGLKEKVLPKKEDEAYLRRADIFSINNKLYFIAISPIVNQDNFNVLGYMVLERPIDFSFAYYLKDRSKSDIIILSKKNKIASTITNEEGKSFFFSSKNINVKKISKVKINDKEYYTTGFSIKDNAEKDVGSVYVLNSLESMILAQKVFFKNFIYIIVIISLILILVAFFLTKIISSPILALSEGAKEISRGNYDIEIKKVSNDEIGELTEIFNQMVVSIKSQRAEILSLQRFLENIFKNLTIALLICDKELNLKMINDEAERVFDINKEDILGKKLYTVIPFLRNYIKDILNISPSKEPIYYDNIEYKKKNNKELILRMIFYKISLENEEYIVIQIEDITKRIRIEERLVQANKLISIGEILSKFSHENNNLLSAVLGQMEILKMKTEEELKEKIVKMEKLVKKSLELSDSILDFSKKKKFLMKKILIRKIVDDIVDFLKITVLKNIDVKRAYPMEKYYVRANEEKVSVVIINLLINAKDAIEEAKRDKGIIKIRLKPFNKLKGDFLQLSIQDNGIGIKEENLERIFDSYYTTKGERGTGLGLANVKEIINDLGGFIKVKSKYGEGTTFYIYFPVY